MTIDSNDSLLSLLDPPGEQQWNDFATHFAEDWANCPPASKSSLLDRLNGDELLASALWGKLHAHAIEWLDTIVPALDLRRPADFLGSELDRGRLRHLIMRMH